MTILGIILISASGMVFAKGVHAWAKRRGAREWVPWGVLAVSGWVAGGAVGMDSLPVFALGCIGMLIGAVMQARMSASES